MSFFNIESVVVGSLLPTETIILFLEEYQSCDKLPQHKMGNFVLFDKSQQIVANATMLNMSPNGAEILIREHYTVDIRCVKYNSNWYITSIVDRRN